MSKSTESPTFAGARLRQLAGALGVAHLMRTLREELELCMAQAGCATLADITPDILFDSASKASPC